MPQANPTPGPARGNRALVLGSAWNLKPGDLELFSKSLRQAAPAADCVLLCKDVDLEVQKMARDQRIELVPLSFCHYGTRHHGMAKKRAMQIRSYVGLKLVRALTALAWPILRVGYAQPEYLELRREITKLVMHTAGSRYVQFLDLLRNRRAHYDKVMLTDVRDVFFQSDPFEHVPADQLLLFQEEPRFTLGTEPRNRRWVQATFGRKILNQIADQPIICSGVTIGGFDNILGYLERMEPELLSRTPVFIPDQGIHNALAYTGAFKHLNPAIVRNGDGPVLTVGFMNPEMFAFDSQGRLLNRSGESYPVVHQYDRHPILATGFRKLVGLTP